MKKFIAILTIVLFLIGIIFFVVDRYGYNYVKIDKNVDLGVNKEVLQNYINPNGNGKDGYKSKIDINNILIIGVDSRDNSYSNTRSDVIVIATINREEKTLKLTSIMRDSFLYIPDRNIYDKINHAYAYGSDIGLIRALNSSLDLNISEFVSVNFESIIKVVDLIGGINLFIEWDEVSRICDINYSGEYLLDGKQTLQYSRLRYTQGGDVRRTLRHRLVIEAILDKVNNLTYNKQVEIIKVMLPYINTSLSFDELISLMNLYFSMNELNIEQYAFPEKASDQMINNIYYMVPSDLELNVIKLHEFMYGESDYEVSQNVKKHSEVIREIVNKNE